MSTTSHLAVAFTHELRRAGLAVPTRCAQTYAEALGVTDVSTPSAVYWAGRATLVHRPEDIEAYDGAFASFFAGRPPDTHPVGTTESAAIERAVHDDDAAPATGPDGADAAVPRWSSDEALRRRDFAAYDADDLRAAHRLMGAMRWSTDRRRSRRRHSGRRRSDTPDVRRTMQRSLRSGGEPIERAFRHRATKERRLVLLLDISGSMEAYARALLRFVHAASTSRRRVEVFAIGTRLTRLTRELGRRDPDRALAAAAERVVDWSGGTRLGPCLRRFNDDWGVRGMARNATVVILSDGWDRGDPTLLADELARLRRVAHRVVWANPLKTTPGYAPLARGMAAALPHIDHFVEGHSIAALEDLARTVAADDRPGQLRVAR